MGRLDGIQVLRAVAVLMVVTSHCWYAAAPGAAGVDLFFVISGFIMIYISKPGEKGQIAKFVPRRALRIIPLYWFATFLAYLFMKPEASGSQLLMSFLFMPLDAQLPVLPVGWTLNIEMMFYALFAVALAFPKRFGLVFLFGALLALGTLRLFFAPPVALLVWSDPLILEFAAGVAIGLAFKADVRIPDQVGAALFAAALSWFAWVAFDGHQYSGENMRVIVWGIPCVFTVAATALVDWPDASPLLRPLIFLGDASYSIYLFHMFVTFNVATRTWIISSMLLAVSILVGCLAHVSLEKPMLPRPAEKRARLQPILGAAE